MKKHQHEITGVINLFKPKDISSFKAVEILKKKINAKKAGHCGTLDPMAEGVLLVCFGKAVRFADILGTLEKKYRGIMKLGEATDTQDQEGVITNKGDFEHLKPEYIERIFNDFKGTIEQYPPMFSAVKHKGKPLYTYARNGIEIDRELREVFVKSILIDKISLPFIHFRVICSKGTFIRTICNDIGLKLGCYAHLFNLERSAIGDYRVQDSIKLEDIPDTIDESYLDKVLLPIDKALYFLQSIAVDDENKTKILNGQQIQVTLQSGLDQEKIVSDMSKVYDDNGNFLCCATRINDETYDSYILQPKIVIYNQDMVKSIM
jgi:tRNA pseudouridine55 synthase